MHSLHALTACNRCMHLLNAPTACTRCMLPLSVGCKQGALTVCHAFPLCRLACAWLGCAAESNAWAGANRSGGSCFLTTTTHQHDCSNATLSPRTWRTVYLPRHRPAPFTTHLTHHTCPPAPLFPVPRCPAAPLPGPPFVGTAPKWVGAIFWRTRCGRCAWNYWTSIPCRRPTFRVTADGGRTSPRAGLRGS